MTQMSERPRPFVVVLTGGPCSGKSSALALLRDRLSSRGFQVLTVPENATHFLANSEGFQPEWAGTHAQVRMQRLFLDYQISQEDAFKEFADLHPTKPAVMLLDCCTMNSKVYTSDEQFQQVLSMPGKPTLTEEGLFARYDLVVHMVTEALEGHYEWGPGSNNPGRYHNREQAQEQEQRCMEVFAAHPQLRVVPHFQSFADKIEKVVEFVKDALHIEGLAGKRCRRACRVVREEEVEAVAASASSSASEVVSTFLDERLQHSVRKHVKISTEAWLRAFRRWRGAELEAGAAEGAAGAAEPLYERRSQVQHPGIPDQMCLTRKVIRKDEYQDAVVSRCSEASVTTKYVLRFVEGSSYYELFFFLTDGDLVLDSSVEDSERQPLAWLEPVQDTPLKAVTPSQTDEPTYKVAEVEEDKQKGNWLNSIKRRKVMRHSTEEAALFGC
mmetsp:Transcript_116417/g.340559  ORF Transcript_116417/g.340559 Transcript_116417/m.340559 type:complete len:442 (-) Transcript_116417:110-1435(-)